METALILLIFLRFGYASGNTVSLTSSSSGKTGESLELKFQFINSGTSSPFTVKWFLNSITSAIVRDASNCDSVSSPPDYDLSRYTFSCNINIFTLTIKTLSLADNGNCWKCRVVLADSSEVDGSACISVVPDNQSLLLLLLLLILLCPLSLFIILFCCGCLDCCKCCRIYDHYDEHKCCYVTWYCLLKGCCSFFCCRPGSEMGNCFCCHADEKGCCGGCHSCEKKCGWPSFCRSKKMRSCGICYCHCCVGKKMDKGSDETAVVMTGNYIETKNKVHPLAPKLPPIQGVTSGETVELKEPSKKKKKKNKDKLDLRRSAEEAAEETTKRMSPEGQSIPGKKLN